MVFQELLNQIKPADKQAYEACVTRFNAVAKPVGSLGKLETLLERVAAIYGDPFIDVDKKCVLVFCGDNGVLAQGVAQSTSDVTTAIGRSMAAGTASVCVMAKACGADVFPIDMGMKEKVAGLLDRRLGDGTEDISRGPAMSRAAAEQGILTGMELVRQRREEGYRIIATGEAGIGNTTTSSAIASVLLGRPVEEVTGRGSGLSDEGLLRKQQAIKTAIQINQPNATDPLDVLSKLGGFDIAGMTGAFLGGALYHVPIVMDGFISAVAALLAVRLCPAVRDYVLPSHITAEPAGVMLMEELGFAPLIHGDLRLGEGTGAVALFPMLDLAAAVYHHAATFTDIKVEAYKPWAR